jgi:hypothetical protein
MIHRLPFSNLVIEPAPEVMPSNNEARPYSIVSFDYWNRGPSFKTFPDRNWGADNDIDYKANKEQGEDIFLKFVPRSEFTGSIYIGVVESGPEVRTYPDAPESYDNYNYETPCSYQIGIGDCDIKHRPWKDLDITFNVEVVETVYLYYDYGDGWELQSTTENILSTQTETITTTESMFDIEPALTVYPASLGGIGPQYVEGYGVENVIFNIGETSYEFEVGAEKTFWTLGDSAYTNITGEVRVDLEADPMVKTVTEIRTTNSYISSLSPASAFEPPTPA